MPLAQQSLGLHGVTLGTGWPAQLVAHPQCPVLVCAGTNVYWRTLSVGGRSGVRPV